MKTQTVTTSRSRQSLTKKLAPTLVAVVATSLLWMVSVQLFEYDLMVPGFGGKEPSAIGVGAVIFSTVLTTVIGRIIFEALNRRSANSERIWLTIALLFTLLSLSGPLLGEGVDAQQRLLLIGFHLLVAALFIPLTLKTKN